MAGKCLVARPYRRMLPRCSAADGCECEGEDTAAAAASTAAVPAPAATYPAYAPLELEPPPPPPPPRPPKTRGLHSFTSQLNLSAVYGIGGACRGYVARVKGVLGGV